jgi:Mg-chelatase subunit ChlD/methylphosphotriester-DNA--protein-cysteine methyltransferase
MLLAFSVGVAIVSVFYFRSKSEPAQIPPATVEFPSDDKGDKALEMVFVIDTTGSMGGLLEGAKQKTWSIINEVMQKSSQPRVKVGLVAYRDHGDAYVTKITPLTEDLDKVYMDLMDYNAAGGGDNPEAVGSALSDAVKSAGWSKSRDGLAQIIFLVGDAPPTKSGNEPDVMAVVNEASLKNMIVNTIQCGTMSETREVWQKIAQKGQGKYFAIAQDGGVENVNTPFDEKISELGRQIGSTYLAYGDADRQEALKESLETTDSKMAANTTVSTKADRALNKAMNKEAYNSDLLQDIENGKTELSRVKEEELPVDLKAIPAERRAAEVEKRISERKKIRQEILDLSKQRDAYLKKEGQKSGKQNGFDTAVGNALSEQLSGKGIN